jgi:hypothetical protein
MNLALVNLSLTLDADHIRKSIHAALVAKCTWENAPFEDRAAIFLRAAELVSRKYRYQIMAATMLGHGKNIWQAEIDAAAERIRSLMHYTTGGEQHDETPIRDGAYGIPWMKNVVDLSGLDMPTEEYAEHLTNTLSLALHPLYHLFDKAAFLVKLRQFYAVSSAGRQESTNLWHILMLVVFAFEHSILAREVGPSGPLGAVYIARAVEAMPNNHRLHREPVISIELLCMLALFMQAMDMRLVAYQYARTYASHSRNSM